MGVLFSSDTYQRLYDEYEAYFEDGDVKVRVVGIPYHGTSYEMDRFFNIEKGDEDYLICVAHVLASERGGTMFEGEDIVKYSDLLDTAPDVYLFGHWHKDQGVKTYETFHVETDKVSLKHFVNLGSLTRGSLSQDEVEREPAMGLICCTKEGVFVETHRLKVAAPEVVFDMDGRARQVKRQVEMDSFVESIRDALAPPAEGATLSDSISGMSDVPNEIRERALSYLEKA